MCLLCVILQCSCLRSVFTAVCVFVFVCVCVFCAGEGSYFDKFLKATQSMTPEERAIALEEDDEVGCLKEGQSTHDFLA